MAKKLATLSNLARFAKNVGEKYAEKADSLAGYGIEDAYTKTEADAAVTFVKNDDIEDITDEEIDELFANEPVSGNEPSGD